MFQEKLKIFDDIKNVREVMAGNISIPDHTALYCVHKHMVCNSKKIETSKIRNYLSALTNFIANLKEIFKRNHDRYFYSIRQDRALERAEAYFAANRAAAQLGKRTRRAPERLNITSTKKKSYL